jgi:hypothetical protein
LPLWSEGNIGTVDGVQSAGETLRQEPIEDGGQAGFSGTARTGQ